MVEAMPIDLSSVRNETPGCRYVTHFNNAGASLPPITVVHAIHQYLLEEANYGAYETYGRHVSEFERLYREIESLIGAKHGEVALDSNSSRAWQLVFQSIPFSPGDRILTCDTAYTSNYLGFLTASQRMGAIIEVLPTEDDGSVSVSGVLQFMDSRVKVVAVTHMPTNGGIIQPVEEIGQALLNSGAIYMVDTTQSIGQIKVDVNTLKCDVLIGTSRKYLRGPRGLGFIYVRQSFSEQLTPILLDSQGATWTGSTSYKIKSDATRFETGEHSPALRMGLLAALDYLNTMKMSDITSRIHRLAEVLRSQISQISGVTVHDLGTLKSGIVTFSKNGMSSSQIRDSLLVQNVNISVSPAEFTLLNMTSRMLDSVARASVHYYNSEDELVRFEDSLRVL